MEGEPCDRFANIAADIVAREGGYVDDPDDPGGATKHGVTIHTMRRLGRRPRWRRGCGQGRWSAASTPERATDIFIEHYFDRPRIGALPTVLQASVFRHVCQTPAPTRCASSRRSSGGVGHDIAVDGIIGPPHAARGPCGRGRGAGPPWQMPTGSRGATTTTGWPTRRPASRKYARRRDGGKGGWIARAEAFIAPRYHLSPAEHRERTASWE